MEEDEKQRIDREWMELIQEIRMILPGVQVLLAFLLVAPFSDRFSELGETIRVLFVVAITLTAAATALLMAPGTYHRLHFRDKRKEEMLFLSHRLMIAGSMLVALAVVCAVFIVSDVLLNLAAAITITATMALFYVFFWFLLPLIRRARSRPVPAYEKDEPSAGARIHLLHPRSRSAARGPREPKG